MALFGAPIAHEDDPERAVRAALAIRDAIREEGELEVRIAVTTGEALVALAARPQEGEGMASGDVVNTAARLQSAAPVNGILVDQTTYRATSPRSTTATPSPSPPKSKQTPVPAWEVLELAPPRHRFCSTGGAPSIGRERELDVLWLHSAESTRNDRRSSFASSRHRNRQESPRLRAFRGDRGRGRAD